LKFPECKALLLKTFWRRFCLQYNVKSPNVFRALEGIKPVTNLGHQGDEEFSERGSNFLNYSNYVHCPT